MGTVTSSPSSSMLVDCVFGLVILLTLGQALPTPVNLQGYQAVPFIASSYLQYRPPVDTPEVAQAKAEFFGAFQRALDGLLYELAPEPVQNNYLEYTQEVR